MIHSRCVRASLLTLVIAAPASAQNDFYSVTGVVLDPQGAAIPDASVDIACGAASHHVTASSRGEFVAAVSGERCRITATSQSFEPETVVVDPRQRRTVTLVLEIRRFASEVVVATSRGIREETSRTPESVSVVSRRDLDSRPYTLLTQVLREEPGVLVQQTTSAQTSPSIRGFTGQSNVYLMDGVRLNTGAWRTGPSQYTSWVEPGVVDSIEVIRGSGSVQYGSDALGGTIQYLSAPIRLGIAPNAFRGSLEVTAASADLSAGALGQLGVDLPGVSITGGASRRTVNDLRAGGGIDSHAAVTRFLGQPSTIVSSRHLDTGFEQSGAFVVADALPMARVVIHGLFMHEDQSDASRYDRIFGGQGLYRSGFDPQTLDFGLVRVSKAGVAGLNGGLSGTFSVNRQADGRFEQTRPTTRIDRQAATTTALGYQLQGHHAFSSRYQLLVGGEYYDEETRATRELVELDGSFQSARPDIPNGTSYASAGVFAQQRADLIADRLSVRGGIRYSTFGFATTPDAVLGVGEEDVTMRSVTFQTGAVARVTPNVNVTANISRAFRAPNAADLGSIGLTGGGGFEITPAKAASLRALVGSTGATTAISTGMPVRPLAPEVVYQYDYGVKMQAGSLSASLNGFNMELFDFIQRRALVFTSNIVGTNISGFDVVRQDASGLAYIAQDVRPIATRVNIDRGRILGLDAEGELRLSRAWTARAHFSTARGYTVPSRDFIRRMPPPMGGASVRWNGSRVWAEGVLAFAAEQTRLNAEDLSDARIGALRTRASIATFFDQNAVDLGLVRNGILVATGEMLGEVQNRVLGSAASAPLFDSQPGWVTIGFRAGVRLSSGLDLTLLLDNVGDVNYRYYGSGLDASGINLQVKTRYRF
jgi:outer membrane receptor protein involved in Fe transport